MWVFPYKTKSQKYEPTDDEPSKDRKNLRLSGGDWNNSMEQMFIVHINYQRWLEPILLQMKIISSTTQERSSFQ